MPSILTRRRLLVTKDCFEPKENVEDKFLNKVRLSLQIDIPIIPVLFTKFQCVVYNKSYSEASIEMLKDKNT